jgi:hypothetical protein
MKKFLGKFKKKFNDIEESEGDEEFVELNTSISDDSKTKDEIL